MQHSATTGCDASSSRRRGRLSGLRRLVGVLAVFGVVSAGVSAGGPTPPAAAAGGSLIGTDRRRFLAVSRRKVGRDRIGGGVHDLVAELRSGLATRRALSVYLRDRTKAGAAANVPVVRPLVAGTLPNGNSFALGV